VRQTMNCDLSVVKTVQDDELPTHLTVLHNVVFLRGLENQLPALLELANQFTENHRTDPVKHRPFKAIVYFNSTAEVALARRVFENLLNNPAEGFSRHPVAQSTLLEMHSRLTQNQRT